jgi:hypothetical protein
VAGARAEGGAPCARGRRLSDRGGALVLERRRVDGFGERKPNMERVTSSMGWLSIRVDFQGERYLVRPILFVGFGMGSRQGRMELEHYFR